MDIMLYFVFILGGFILGFFLCACLSAGKTEDALRHGFEEGLKRGKNGNR